MAFASRWRSVIPLVPAPPEVRAGAPAHTANPVTPVAGGGVRGGVGARLTRLSTSQ